MIRWNLRRMMAEKNQIYSVTELQVLIVKKSILLGTCRNLFSHYDAARSGHITLDWQNFVAVATNLSL